ncbi:MAG TPA: EamA family transporter [Streptosporangiaceae bacterium]|nr:EamA family transporter [Streptosporangiaceae bacterium]
MNPDRRSAIAALTTAGLLWGTTVPLSKLALEWLPPGWLTFARFALAAAVLLAAARSRVRAACTPAVLACGAIGYGGSVVVQNAGIVRTSVSHAALLIGATPVLVAVIAALWHHSVARPVAWAGFAVSLAGVGLVAGGGGRDATAGGDGLVLASLLLSATFTVAQTRLLRGRDPVAVTAVQFMAAALAVLPVSLVTEGMPAAPSGAGTFLATGGLALGGTLLPFTLFAYGQGRVTAEAAAAFLNLEPLVGAVAGVVIFGDPAGPRQVAGGAAILAGIALGSLPLLAAHGRGPQSPPAPAACGSARFPGRRRRRPGRKPETRMPPPGKPSHPSRTVAARPPVRHRTAEACTPGSVRNSSCSPRRAGTRRSPRPVRRAASRCPPAGQRSAWLSGAVTGSSAGWRRCRAPGPAVAGLLHQASGSWPGPGWSEYPARPGISSQAGVRLIGRRLA